MRAAAQTRARTARFALASLVGAAMLLGAAGARAEQPESTAESQRLRSADATLAAESRSVVLELYALESRLGRAQARLAGLRAQTGEVERDEAAARRNLAVLRSNLNEANARLADRLRQLYTESDPDPIAVLLGAESLDAAISTLDNLGRFAGQDRRIVQRVKEARVEVEKAIRALEKRRAELAALTREAAASEADLLAARGERQGYLARLREERRLNAAQLARLETAAQSAEQKSTEIQAGGAADSSSTGGDGGGSSPAPAPAPAPVAAPSAPAGPGRQMTVEATGYALPGTTATGIPVGWGVVAVDPSVIPLGTRMTIPGYGEGVAADTGGAVKGAIIDLWFPTRAQALAWGRRTVTITLH